MVGISPYVVCDEQKWLVYHPFCLLWTVMVCISGWYINRISLLWTILVVISTGFVCHGQYWSVYPPVLSVVNNIGCYISMVCVP